MLKKIFIILSLFFISYINVLAEDTKKQEANKKVADREKFCNENTSECIEKSTFTIDVGNIIGKNKTIKSSGDTKKLVNELLGTIIQNLMIAMGSISLLIMTVGSGYMIFYSGQDDLLSKGKSIFTGGLIALSVALSSYYIVAIIRFILYKGN